MKVVFVGGGAHRHLGIIRSAMAAGSLFEGGEIHLYDIDVPRAEAMGRMLMKTPEYAGISCKVAWGASLDEALDGADAVSVVLMAGSRRSFALGDLASQKHGFMSSDQLSPNGAFLALKGGPILMNIARKLERLSPDAWIIDFANPVAVLSAAVNNHTKIRALGVCGGYTNHCWDLARLMGKDEECFDFDVEVAGVNHLSFILRGKLGGRDLYEVLGEHLTPDWRPPKFQPHWNAVTRRNIRFALWKLVELYHKFGVVIFSTEGDGMAHLFYEEMYEMNRRPMPTRAAILKSTSAPDPGRQEANRQFCAFLEQDLDAEFWASHWKKDWNFRRADNDIIVKILRGLGGTREEKIVTSHPSRGAVDGFKDRTVLEYSQTLKKGRLRPYGNLAVPDAFHGLISSLATHQTLLGDAIGTEDPRALHRALFAYPIQQNTKAARALYRDLLEINRDEIPASFQKARDLF